MFIYKGYLYAFFGKYKNGDYPCSIERLNMNSNAMLEVKELRKKSYKPLTKKMNGDII